MNVEPVFWLCDVPLALDCDHAYLMNAKIQDYFAMQVKWLFCLCRGGNYLIFPRVCRCDTCNNDKKSVSRQLCVFYSWVRRYVWIIERKIYLREPYSRSTAPKSARWAMWKLSWTHFPLNVHQVQWRIMRSEHPRTTTREAYPFFSASRVVVRGCLCDA